MRKYKDEVQIRHTNRQREYIDNPRESTNKKL